MTDGRYAALLARLFSARRFGIVLGTDRMRGLLDRLGAPDRRLGTVIHVGGTNGKGSTAAMIAALATAGGARVAVYSSPHLTTLRERIVIAGEMIGVDALVDAAERVAAAGGDELTFFEQVTAMAVVAIAEAAVDVTILEVGLGGRHDATAAVSAPISVITGVALDHQAILGDTLEAIAAEKAGIFRPGQRAVIGAAGEPAAVPLLVAAATRAGATVTVVDDRAIAAVPRVGLPGPHQRRNAATALAVIDQLAACGVSVDAARRASALAAVRHPGRFEVIERGLDAGGVILDGAHNPHGAAALAEALRERRELAGGDHPALILAVSEDKDARAIVAALAPEVRRVIATRYRQERAMDPEELATATRGVTTVPVETAPDLDAALRAAAGERLVVIAGSLFLVGEARTGLLGAPTDPVVVGDPSIVTR